MGFRWRLRGNQYSSICAAKDGAAVSFLPKDVAGKLADVAERLSFRASAVLPHSAAAVCAEPGDDSGARGRDTGKPFIKSHAVDTEVSTLNFAINRWTFRTDMWGAHNGEECARCWRSWSRRCRGYAILSL
jgi:hypothetical protein